MNIGNEIAAAFMNIQRDEEREVQSAQRKAAMEVMRRIPSGTRDADLTPEQMSAVFQYEDAMRRLAQMREEEEL